MKRVNILIIALVLGALIVAIPTAQAMQNAWQSSADEVKRVLDAQSAEVAYEPEWASLPLLNTVEFPGDQVTYTIGLLWLMLDLVLGISAGIVWFYVRDMRKATVTQTQDFTQGWESK